MMSYKRTRFYETWVLDDIGRMLYIAQHPRYAQLNSKGQRDHL